MHLFDPAAHGVQVAERKIGKHRDFSQEGVHSRYLYFDILPRTLNPSPTRREGLKNACSPSLLVGEGVGRWGEIFYPSRSIIVPVPMPPPQHIVCRPYLPPRVSSAPSSVAIRRAPDAPSGCPSAIAPP